MSPDLYAGGPRQGTKAHPRPFTSRWAPREMLLSPGRSTLRVVFHFLVADMPAAKCLSASVLAWTCHPHTHPLRTFSHRVKSLRQAAQPGVLQKGTHAFRYYDARTIMPGC